MMSKIFISFPVLFSTPFFFLPSSLTSPNPNIQGLRQLAANAFSRFKKVDIVRSETHYFPSI